MTTTSITKTIEYWTPNELARVFHCHVSTIKRRIRAGKLPASHIPGVGYRIHPDDVAKLLQPVPNEEGGAGNDHQT